MQGKKMIGFMFALALILRASAQTVVPTYQYLELENLIWADQQNIFMKAYQQGLYRSSDEGMHWVKQSVNETMIGSDTYVFSGWVQDGVNSDKILFYDNAVGGWITEDGGDTYTRVEYGIDFSDGYFQSHPTQSGWILGLGWAENAKDYMFYYTQDMGATWGPVPGSYQWVQWASSNDKSLQSSTLYLWDEDGGFSFSNDWGKTLTLLQKGVVGFVLTDNYLFTGTMDGSNVKLWAAPATASTTGFKEASFPFGELPVNSYHFLDDSLGSEWIGVKHSEEWGHIYISGNQGRKYALSLTHTHSDGDYFDFISFSGLPGIFLANNISNYQDVSWSVAPRLKTVITYDNGGEWQYLAPPKVDSLGNPIVCSGTCSLNLNGITAWAMDGSGYFYSSSNAIGLLLAVGSIGEWLIPGGDQLNTYFSRDAGLTWMELKKGAYIYEFGDHGGILVMANSQDYTTQIYYSLNEGLDLESATFSETPIKVDNIRTELSVTGRKFILHGRDQTNRGVVVGLDFSALQPRECDDTDYEEWSPSDGRNNTSCVLGHTDVYSRKLREANCFNNRATEHLLSSTNCSCAIEDYACDFGFEGQFLSGQYTCVLTGELPADPPADCTPGTTYEVSKGYRIVPGDTCTVNGDGALDLRPVVKWCPGTNVPGGDKISVGVIVGIIISILAVVGGIAFFLYRNNSTRERIKSALGLGGAPRYSPLLGGNLAGDEEFGLDDDEEAQVLEDNDITHAATNNLRDDSHDFDPRGDK